MTKMIQFIHRPKPPEEMRRTRLTRLSAPQELFVETLVNRGDTYVLRIAGNEIGYAVTNGDGQVLELHLEDFRLRSTARLSIR